MAKRKIKKPNIDLEVKKGIAWAVHAFTTCGIVAGFLALVAVLKSDAGHSLHVAGHCAFC